MPATPISSSNSIGVESPMKVPFLEPFSFCILRFVAVFVIIMLGSFSSLRAQQLLDGIVGYWPLEEGAGDVTNDSFGDVQDVGELRNEPEWLTGEDAFLGNGSLFFDGVVGQQDVLIPNSADFNFTTNGASISAWVNTELLPSELSESFGGILDSIPDAFVMYLDRGNMELRVKFTTSDGVAERPGIPEDMLEVSEWIHVAGVYDGAEQSASIYLNGELIDTHDNAGFGEPIRSGQVSSIGAEPNVVGDPGASTRFFPGSIDDVAVWNRAISEDEVAEIHSSGLSGSSLFDLVGGDPQLAAGDADQDLDFDQLDLVKVQIAAKYLTGTPATWGEGDWNGAPGGSQGSPPAGDGQFDQLDIISALGPAHYLTGPYAALAPGPGVDGDGQTSLRYDPSSGELSIDPAEGKELTSINITSAGSIFIGDKPAALDGAFDNFAADNVFKATFGGSFGSISFGNILPIGLAEITLAADLSAVGSLAGGGDLGDVDLVYVPEPASALILVVGLVTLLFRFR